jgi:tetratricopeptide (TPR) repeat protein
MLPLDVSPVATFLVGLAERRPSGTVSLVARALHLSNGEIAEISAAPGDPSLGEFLVQSERLSAAAVSEVAAHAKSANIGFDAALLATDKLSKPELKSLLRACWLDRFVRELRAARAQPKLVPTLDATQRVNPHGTHPTPLLSFVLDAWTRLSVDSDAAAVGMRIDFRLVWVPGPLQADAQRWAALPELQERPVVSAVLGRVPAAAAEIAALVRAGFVKLVPPGAQPVRQRSRKETLPPPPPRLSTLADLPSLPSPAARQPSAPKLLAVDTAPPPPAALASLQPSLPSAPLRPSARSSQTLPAVAPITATPMFSPPTAAAAPSLQPAARSTKSFPALAGFSPLPVPPMAAAAAALSLRPSPRPATPLPAATSRAPRLQLQPGGAGVEIEPIPDVQLTRWPATRDPIHDPLRDLELKVAELEEQNAPGNERARAFIQLAALWQSRIGSLEHATRALREAAAADPDNTQVLLQTARQCGALGQLSLALAYARAVAYTADAPADRAAGHRALADLHAAQGDSDNCLEALSEAGAEDPENPEPHELLAQLHFERGQVSLAVAHATRAAAGFTGRTAKRALGWHALAYAWDPSDPAIAESYRHALDAGGHIDAAVAVSAETARNARTPEARRQLRMDTAQFARARGRSDLAADLLLEIFDDDPTCHEIYGQLDADWSQPGLTWEHCALLESIARVCPRAQKQRWWTRYAQLLSELPGLTEIGGRALAIAQQFARDAAAAEAEIAAIIEDLEARLADATDQPQEGALLDELCGWQLLGGDLRRVVSCTLRQAALQPNDPLAAARLWRATALRKDSVLSPEALTWLARTQSGAVQVRSLSALAREHEALGDFAVALECAEATLASQPSAADAAIVVLRHAHRLSPPRAAALLTELRPLFGCCPPLALTLAEAARAGGDRPRALSAVNELSAQMPLLLEPRLFLLELQAAHDEPGPLLAAALGLLAHSQDAGHVAKAETAVLRLVELGAIGQAARLAQHILDARCRADLAYATSAAELARASGDTELATLAFERVVSLLHGDAQLESLAGVAEHHRRRQDRVAEVRAWLRVLSLSPGQPDALTHLTRLFAESGDVGRLLVVLSIGLEAMTEPDERRQRLLDMASAAAQVGEDRERAAQYISALLHESLDDRHWLRTGLGALFVLGDSNWATEQARALCETLPADVAAIMYLWLAHRAETSAGDTALALELALEGARRFPASGELLLMAERLSLAVKDRDSAVALYSELIEGAIGDHGKRALAYRAGRWLERTGSYDEALEQYSRAFELAKTTGVAYKALERVARASRKLLPLAQAQETLAELAADDRSRLGMLRAAARTSMVDLDDPERGFRNLLKADALTQVGELDGALSEAAQRIGERDGGARERVLLELAQTREKRAQQLWDGEPKAQLLLNTARLHLHERGDPEASAATLMPLMAQELNEQVPTSLQRDSLITLAEAQIGAGRRAEALAAVERALDIAPTDREAIELRGRLTQPPAAPRPAGIPRGVLHAASNSGKPARELLLERLRARNVDAASLRALHDQARLDGATPETQIAGQILSLFDRAITPSQRPPFRGELLSPQEASRFVHGDADIELRQLTRMLWECVRAIPQLRRDPQSLGLDEAQRIRPGDRSPLAAAFARCAQLLGQGDIALYVEAEAPSAVEVWPTHPPCLVARADFSHGPAQMFGLAQCMVFAEPEHAVAAVLPEQEGRELLIALLGAFGPPGSAGEQRSASKDLASQLWHAVPVRVQAQLRELVRLKLPLLVYERLREEAVLSGYRAGLLASRDLRSALESFVSLQSELHGVDIHSAPGFEAACERSAGLRELIRVAFGETYLAVMQRGS